MKVRTGFVSNSSSSSFIVWMDKKDVPETVEELQELMFGDEKVNAYDDGLYNTFDIAYRVFEDMHGEENEDNSIMKNESARDAILGMGYDELDRIIIRKNSWNYIDDENEFYEKNFGCKNYEDQYKYIKYFEAILGYKKLIEKEKKLKDKAVYVFCYADENGEAWLEHGEIFRNLDHITISNH